MTLYVKGFKVDREKVANIVEAESTTGPLVEAGIRAVVDRLNRDAYISIVTGYEPKVDGTRHLALVVALEIDDDQERLKNKELETIDESIKVAAHHQTLVGPHVWELCD